VEKSRVMSESVSPFFHAVDPPKPDMCCRRLLNWMAQSADIAWATRLAKTKAIPRDNAFIGDENRILPPFACRIRNAVRQTRPRQPMGIVRGELGQNKRIFGTISAFPATKTQRLLG
jgi:hypothetical protein